MRRSVLLLALVLVSSCGGEAPPPPAPPTPPPPPPQPTASLAPVPEKPSFENPGGMWMPSQMPAHAAKLKELGLQIDPAQLSDPTSPVLGAIVSLGGCSASFVSPDGLVITNHHCATGALQHNSTPKQNLLTDGWLAKTRADEKNNGPQARVLVTRAVTDVTPKVTSGLDAIADDRARWLEIEKRQKELVAACEKGRPGIRCSVTSFYEGASYYQIEQLEIRDVRLVWAPPKGVGNFGGEIDNWRWPRHTGDVSMFRAYVGKDGQPADYAADNVPYHPPSFLKIAKGPLRTHDLVFVAGYPGRTNSLKTKPEVDDAVSWSYPRQQKLFEDYLARLEELVKDDKEAQIKATSYVRRFGNALTNVRGQLEGLVKGGVADDKARSDAALRAFIDGDPARKAKWGGTLDDVAKEIEKNAAHREADAEVQSELQLPKLVSAATTIVRMAEERAKPDAQRDPDYQERNWPRHEQALRAMTAAYTKKVDQGLLVLAIERAAKQPEKDRSAAVAMIAKDVSSRAAIEKSVAALWNGTRLDDEKARVELLKKASLAELRASHDPLIQLAVKMRPLLEDAEHRQERMSGHMAIVKPKIIDAMRAWKNDVIAPDANGTLRITYGTVRGYRPTPNAPFFAPFTTLSEVLAKTTGQDPFDTPDRLVATAKAHKVLPYVDEKLNDVPVDFLSDLHITGGNSGSATLNAKGELVGLAFDGNYESMASGWMFMPSITRSIHVDIRYIEWLLDAVDNGDDVLKEMGVAPKID